jgi:hypothetical protein
MHERPNQLSREEERDWLGRAITSITNATGERPRGLSRAVVAVTNLIGTRARL